MRGARACILAWQPPLKHRLADASKLLPSTPLLPVYHQLRCRLRHASRRCRSRHLGRRRARHVCALRQVRRRAGRGSASSCPAVQPPLAALCWGVGHAAAGRMCAGVLPEPGSAYRHAACSPAGPSWNSTQPLLPSCSSTLGRRLLDKQLKGPGPKSVASLEGPAGHLNRGPGTAKYILCVVPLFAFSISSAARQLVTPAERSTTSVST